MSVPVFLAASSLLRAVTVGEVIRLDGPEGRHAAKVRRLGVGERLEVTDGAGLVCAAEVAAVRGDALELRVLARRKVPAPALRLIAVQALAKGGRDELAVETMTEIGVDEIVPWQAARSVVRWDAEKAAKGAARWTATAREAGKQARRGWLPVVATLATTAQVASRLGAVVDGGGLAVVLHEAADKPLAGLTPPAAGELVVVVGPEGGIADDEIAAFETAGALTCRLGPTVLRTSTAGAAALAVLCARSGRWA